MFEKTPKLRRSALVAVPLIAALTLAGCSAPPEEDTAGETEDHLVLVDDAAIAAGVVIFVAGTYVAHVVSCTGAPEGTLFCGDVHGISRGMATLLANGWNLIAPGLGAARESVLDIFASLDRTLKTAPGQFVRSAQEVLANLARPSAASRSAVAVPDLEATRRSPLFMSSMRDKIGTKNNGQPCSIARYDATVQKAPSSKSFMDNRKLAVYVSAPSPAAAQSGAALACEWMTDTFFTLGAGYAGFDKSKYACKPARELRAAENMACPGLRVCIHHGTSPECVDVL